MVSEARTLGTAATNSGSPDARLPAQRLGLAGGGLLRRGQLSFALSLLGEFLSQVADLLVLGDGLCLLADALLIPRR